MENNGADELGADELGADELGADELGAGELSAGELVKVATGGPQVDGIVFDIPSDAKVVVAMMDRRRGPVLRTVDRKALNERAEAGPDDRALLLLVRRTSRAGHGAAPGWDSAAGSGRAGHTRASRHRTTGK
jgi:hypothetical protein